MAQERPKEEFSSKLTQENSTLRPLSVESPKKDEMNYLKMNESSSKNCDCLLKDSIEKSEKSITKLQRYFQRAPNAKQAQPLHMNLRNLNSLLLPEFTRAEPKNPETGPKEDKSTIKDHLEPSNHLGIERLAENPSLVLNLKPISTNKFVEQLMLKKHGIGSDG